MLTLFMLLMFACVIVAFITAITIVELKNNNIVPALVVLALIMIGLSI